MKTVVVLAMHGMPPRDFPPEERVELFGLRARLHQGGEGSETMVRRHAELDAKMRAWPRTSQNDPYHAGAYALSEQVSRRTDHRVVVGFNEFCDPTLDQALDQAALPSPERVVVITPMMTRGGSHSELDIPAAIERARQRHPHLDIHYAWPFELASMARFLSEQIDRSVREGQVRPGS